MALMETLIVWSESDTCDLALSFQEKSGCEEIWAKICEKDKRLMKELFDQLRDPETTVSRRRDLAFFLKEFISLSQGLPPNGAQSKDNFFKVLRTLLDPDNMVSMQKSDRSEFLSLFYQRSIYTLVKPMMDNVKGGTIKRDDYCTANRQSLVVRLLCFCIEHHSFSMRQHCISNDLLNKVLVLLQSKHHFLALAALKMLRTVLAVKDDFYNRYIVREKVLDRVVECFVRNGARYNC
ncbi:hypothetical protein TELCIR_19863 [Teladorsagia circumcincta]|uniref:Uncharacterized protein n=1 Tax=Teladorsagia circumcincta TaxID=45464 RepID=A0A2G9TLE3_TELCI|nr:hypothetical protein TELCIR_19863 [Teladorsagia circumcincta]